MRKICSFIVLATLIWCCVQSVNANITDLTILPNSSLYQGQTNIKYGSTDGWILGKLEFAVYDTTTYENEFIGTDGFINPGSGRYIYAYQLFVDSASTAPLEYFAIQSVDGHALGGIETIGSQDDGTSGIAPTDISYSVSEDKGIWEFEGGILIADAHSYFLVFSSDSSYTTGTYTVNKASNTDTPIPNPEPATLALLGIGTISALLSKVKRKSSVK